jgi:hypothetical protein
VTGFGLDIETMAHRTMYLGTIRTGRAARAIPMMPTYEYEWSEFGRDSHFPPGWWVIPAFALGLASWVGIFSLIF